MEIIFILNYKCIFLEIINIFNAHFKTRPEWSLSPSCADSLELHFTH